MREKLKEKEQDDDKDVDVWTGGFQVWSGRLRKQVT